MRCKIVTTKPIKIYKRIVYKEEVCQSCTRAIPKVMFALLHLKVH